MNKKTPSKIDTSAPGWRIPNVIRDDFTTWCRRHGRGYEKELAKALYLWIRESSAVRELVERAIAGDPDIGDDFWQTFAEQGAVAAAVAQKRLREKKKTPCSAD